MSLTDPIADMLTRIRNAIVARHESVLVPASRTKIAIAKVLKEEGFEVGERQSKDVPPELLEEVFELNMALEGLRGGDSAVRSELEAALARFRSIRNGIDGELRVLYASYDRDRRRETLVEIRQVLDRRRYVQNLVGEVEKEFIA